MRAWKIDIQAELWIPWICLSSDWRDRETCYVAYGKWDAMRRMASTIFWFLWHRFPRLKKMVTKGMPDREEISGIRRRELETVPGSRG